MNVMLILLVAIALMMVSGVPGTLFSARSAGGQKLATALLSLGALLGLACVALARAGGAEVSLDLAWGVPGSRFAVALDAVGAVFLLPVFVVPALGSVYGHGYWRQSEHPANGRRLTLAYGVLAGAMALVVLARDGLLFLIAWEVMALAAYFAATAEDDKPEVRRAGWIYLVATHVGTLCLFAMFSLWRASTGSLGLASATALPAATASALFLLALVGFGFKAGLMPLHVWLPGAHANAPSHVSAVMSGVMLKMGVYGLVRMTLLLPAGPSWWGYTVLAMGAVSSVAGIAFAIGQRDLKRLLAYSSIENIGIVAMGLGLALLGRTEGRPVWVLLGLSGALLHVWNHSLFKSLLFLNAGAVIHAVETREIDRMGGLAKRMPKAAALFAVGAAAICALPPLNGFAGEWLLYNGLFTALGLGPGPSLPAAAVAVAALAMTGALAVACFVKLFATVYLGEARLPESAPHEAGPLLLGPMALLAVGCVAVGLLPALAMAPLEAAARQWATLPELPRVASVAPLGWLTALGAALVAGSGALALAVRLAVKGRVVRRGPTWDCGYARPTARMQYTGSSLGASIMGLTSFVVWPTHFITVLRGLFPRRPAAFKSVVPDVVLDRLVIPVFRAAGRYLPRLRVLQQGQTHVYVLYILLVMIVLLLWGNVGG